MNKSEDSLDITLEIQVTSPYKLETKNELLKMHGISGFVNLYCFKELKNKK